jgi:APA family basic amino acid/polyamine antiporter
VMSGARIPFAAARDGLFFPRFGQVNQRFKSPAYSLVVQGLLSTVLLLALGRFQQLFELAVFAEWLFYMLTATTVFVYRRRHPEMERPYKVWGYPVLPAVFVVCAGVVLVSSFRGNLKGSLIGSGLILLGLPLYEWIRRRYGVKAAI